MKLLDNAKFEAVNSLLCMDLGCGKIEGRIESYSCKMTRSDKQLYKKLKEEHKDAPGGMQALSPPQSKESLLSLARSGVGKVIVYGSEEQVASVLEGNMNGLEICDAITIKTLSYLISILNIYFSPDYDFSGASSTEFSKELSVQAVMTTVDTQLYASAGGQFGALKQQLWVALDKEINFNDCEIYSYNPDMDSDPYADEGCLWSFNYFFFNPNLKRIVFFTCKASSNIGLLGDGINMEVVD